MSAAQALVENLPEELRVRDQFVLYRIEIGRDGKETKVPYQVRRPERKASVTDSLTWASYEEAVEAFKSGHGDGIGFVFSSGDPFAGVDLDDCRDPETGEIASWVKKIIDAFGPGAYVEASPSGTGAHIIVRGKAPNSKRGPVEAYSWARFFTITGEVIGETPVGRLPERQQALDALAAKYLTERADRETTNDNGHRASVASLSDEEIVERLRNAKNAAKFSDLFDRGDTRKYHDGDDSRADQSLATMLALYTDDPAQIARLVGRSALMRPKWNRADYRRRTIDKAIATAQENRRNRNRNPYGDDYGYTAESTARTGTRLRSVRFVDMEPPTPRRYVLEGLIPADYPTIIYGDGGVAKSLIALSLGQGVAGDASLWLGHAVETGGVLYVDFELDAQEQNRRIHQLARAEGLSRPPEGLRYMSALGYPAREAFEAALAECQDHGICLVIVDSLGPAMEGDAEAARDVIGFYQRVIEPFRAAGVAVMVIDHQSKLQAGERYQNKRAFGSVFKGNLARSVIQVEAADRGENTLTVRVRHKKHNFGKLADPFGIALNFTEERITLDREELDATDLSAEDTLNDSDRVLLALLDGPAYADELVEKTGITSRQVVKNALTKLRKAGQVEATGEKNHQKAEQVRLTEAGVARCNRNHHHRDYGYGYTAQPNEHPFGTNQDKGTLWEGEWQRS